jgi:uncharacterized repeat protein (TIGR01451 family)
MNTTGNNNSVLNRFNKLTGLALALAPTLWSSALAGPVLQGQNKGDTVNWYAGNLQGWGELEYIPLRVYFAAGSAGNQTVRIDFPHLNGKLFGFEDLAAFAAVTPNLAFTSAPVLTTDPTGVWSYTFSVRVSDANPAQVRFFARMASGAHLNGGSSLQIKGSAGNVQIHKPGPASGAPNLAVSQTGPATASRGATVTYTVSYTNKASTYPAMGAQLSQIIDPQLTVDPATLGPNAHIVGNTIFWDLGNLLPQASGQISFLATVNLAAPIGLAMNNVAQVYSSENDLDLQDNTAVTTTSVVCGTASATIVANPVNVTVCPGDPATFSTSATGPDQLTFQWRKDGAAIAGATSPSFTVPSVGSADLGTYDVLVTSPCDVAVSGTAVLSFRPGLPLNLTAGRFEADGAFVIEFGTICGGQYVIEYSNDLVTWKTSPQTATGNGLTVAWRDVGQPATESMPNTLTMRFYRVRTAF